MGDLLAFVQKHGYAVLFWAVFIDQAGAPLPSLPLLFAIGALAGLGEISFGGALVAATLACVAADYLWYELGRRKGVSVLSLLCRFSLEPDSCVNSTTRAFERYGAPTLLVAKFIPGLDTVAPPLAGVSRMTHRRFLIYDAAGSGIWAGAGLGVGFLFKGQVEAIMEWLSNFGGAVLLILGTLSMYLLFKYIHRRATLKLLQVDRIAPEDLHERMKSGEPITIVDLRARILVDKVGYVLPGARVMHSADAELHLRDTPRGQHLVFYCS